MAKVVPIPNQKTLVEATGLMKCLECGEDGHEVLFDLETPDPDVKTGLCTQCFLEECERHPPGTMRIMAVHLFLPDLEDQP